jgi:hypothetical protein
MPDLPMRAALQTPWRRRRRGERGATRIGVLNEPSVPAVASTLARMTAFLLLLNALTITTGGALSTAVLRDGDVIFQESRSAQSRAIQLPTKSRFSHMGILFSRSGHWYVYEAVGPVKFTPLDAWTRRGRGGHFVVKRLRNTALLTPATTARMHDVAKSYAGKPYDLYFEWDDRRIYCSELVWKIYKGAVGVELGQLQKLRDFDLRDPLVRKKLTERYGMRIPLEEPVISPGAMFNSEKLVQVLSR